MTERADRPPVRARSGRRYLPPLLFLTVLALAAGLVWWNVLRQENEAEADQAAACATAQEAPPSLDPTTVSVRVLNATDRAGIAQAVADQLSAQGFVVDEVANDNSEREVTGVGEVRHGLRGEEAAAFLAAFLPGVGDYTDTRATAQVDLVLGPEFQQLAAAEQVAAALDEGQSAAAACSDAP